MKTRVKKQWWACFRFVVPARRRAFYKGYFGLSADTLATPILDGRTWQMYKALEIMYRSAVKKGCDEVLQKAIANGVMTIGKRGKR